MNKGDMIEHIAQSAEISKLAALQGAEINEAKKALATAATALIHGREKAEAAAETARKTFEQGALAADLPTVEIAKSELDAGLSVLAAFVRAGLVASNLGQSWGTVFMAFRRR